MKISKKAFPSKKGEITVFRIENESGAWVELSSLGAGIIGLGVPDKSGKIENVALRYADPADYLYDGPCMGKIPGRYANRIALGLFSINGKEYALAVNNGPNALHGGPEGFQQQIWAAEELASGVRFTYVSAVGEEGYPGKLIAEATYEWTEGNDLKLTLKATTDAPTIVNLTNHAYWNLDGADSGSVLNHNLQLKAGLYLPTDDSLIPSGDMVEVADTPMDFTKGRLLGDDIHSNFAAIDFGKGYDSCWVIDGAAPGVMIEDAAVLKAPESGRVLRVSTDQPGVQIYTGNWLAGSPKNESGRSYDDYDGVAIEMQGFPDAPNHPEFPSQQLNPGETYERNICFSFSVE